MHLNDKNTLIDKIHITPSIIHNISLKVMKLKKDHVSQASIFLFMHDNLLDNTFKRFRLNRPFRSKTMLNQQLLVVPLNDPINVDE